MSLKNHKDKEKSKPRQEKNPLPSHQGIDLEVRSGSNTLRKTLLIALPIIGIILVGVLVWLIIKMPKTRNIRLERNTIPLPSQKATQPRETKMAKITQPDPQESMPVKRSVITKQQISRLIRTGAGIPPGMQDSPKLADNPSSLIWKSPVAVKVNQNPPEEPAASAEEPAVVPPSEEAVNVEAPTEIQPPPAPAEEMLPPEATPEQPQTEPESGGQAFIDAIYDENNYIPTNLQAYVYGDLVNVRATDDMNGEIIDQVEIGEVVYELGANGSWSHILLADGREGYIYSSLLSYNYVAPTSQEATEPLYQEEEFSPYSGTLWSLFSGVNIRQEPGLDGEVIGTLYYGDSCEALAYTGGWFQVLLADGSLGYVHGDYLTETPVEAEELGGEIQHEEVPYIVNEIPDTPANLAGGNAVVNTALQYVGYPYVYGASGPNAFDCSGFAQYVYSQQGVTIGRSTYDQVYDGIAVSFGYKDYSNMVPGDLVLFGEGTNVYHVGIYIGGGQMVHAGNESTGVVVDNLNQDYWAARIASVRRIFY